MGDSANPRTPRAAVAMPHFVAPKTAPRAASEAAALASVSFWRERWERIIFVGEGGAEVTVTGRIVYPDLLK